MSRRLAHHQIKYRLGDEPLEAVQDVPIDVAPISPSSDPGRKLVGAGGDRKIAADSTLNGSSKATGAVSIRDRSWFSALVRPSTAESLATFNRRITSITS